MQRVSVIGLVWDACAHEKAKRVDCTRPEPEDDAASLHPMHACDPTVTPTLRLVPLHGTLATGGYGNRYFSNRDFL